MLLKFGWNENIVLIGDDLNALDQSDVEVVRRCMLLKFGAYHCVDFLQLTRDLSENQFFFSIKHKHMFQLCFSWLHLKVESKSTLKRDKASAKFVLRH
jgi:hypothetical protein